MPVEDVMEKKPEQKQNRQSPEHISTKQEKPPLGEEYDPLREESTDYRAPGEKFETLGEGKNLDRNRMDQPRTERTSLPEALKDLGPATKRPLDTNDEEEKRLFEERQKRIKKVA
jgi:hypothetical protein